MGNNPVNNIDPLGLDWFRNTRTGQTYWEDRTEAYEDEEYLGENYVIEGTAGNIYHEQNEQVDYTRHTARDNTKNALAFVDPILIQDQVDGNSNSGYLSSSVDGVGGLGTGMMAQGGSFRLTDGAYNGNSLSVKHYATGWRGGSRAQITTYGMGTTGKLLSRTGTAGTVIIGGADIAFNAINEGGFGTQTQRATGRLTGSLAGASAGAAIGVNFFGIGVIPGGIIGGVIGGWGGSAVGEKTVIMIQEY